MPFPSIVDPVVGTVITAAWEIANPLAAVRWLRQLMGNADPPGSSYVVVSSSVSSGSWAKVPSDALAPGVAVANLGYTPVNKAGDSGIGNLTSAGTVSAALVSASSIASGGGVQAGAFIGGSKTAGGTVSVQGLAAGANGITSDAGIGAGYFQGGSTGVGGTVNFQGLQTGASGIAAGGPITCTSITPTVSYGGGTTTAGAPSMLGLSVGVNGIAVAGLVAFNRVAGAPFSVASQVQVTNLHADLLDGAHASVTPVGNAIPIADASGKLDAWVTPSGAAAIPSSGVCGYDAAIASLPSGWTRFSAADGRILVGDGTLFSQTFLAGANYGSAWGHAHATTWASHAHSGAALSVAGSIGGPSATTAGGEATPSHTYGSDTHTHSHTLDVAGSTDAAGGGGSSTDTWLPPMRGVYWIKKT